MKIYITGGPGSGKTTTADRLSKQYNIPHFDLDDINWKNDNACFYGQKRDPDERKEILANLLNNHSEWPIHIFEKNKKEKAHYEIIEK